MIKMDLTSTITFLYFKDLKAAKVFMENVLGLEPAYDPGWACVYRLTGKSFLGAVDAESGSVEAGAQGGVLISLTVSNLEDVHRHLKELHVQDLSEVRRIKDMPLKSFFFTGPEGYRFEVEQFTSGELQELF